MIYSKILLLEVFKILFSLFYVFLFQELYIVLLKASTSASNHCLKSRGVVSLGEILYPVQRRNNFLYKKRFILSCKILCTIHKNVYIAVSSDPATAFIFQKKTTYEQDPKKSRTKYLNLICEIGAKTVIFMKHTREIYTR